MYFYSKKAAGTEMRQNRNLNFNISGGCRHRVGWCSFTVPQEKLAVYPEPGCVKSVYHVTGVAQTPGLCETLSFKKSKDL